MLMVAFLKANTHSVTEPNNLPPNSSNP